jgi:hypothetical protein
MLRRPVLRWVICGGELRLSYACRSNESADVTRVRRAPGAPLAASPSCRQPVGPGPAQARARHAGTPGPGGGVMMTHLRCTLQPHARRPRSFPSGSRRGVLGALLLPVPEIPVPNSTSRSVRSSGVVKSSLSPAGLCSKRKRQRGHSSAYFRRAISSHSVPEVFNYEPCHCIFFANIFSNDTCRLAV